MIQAANGRLVGIIIALDRQERGLNSPLSAIQEVENEFALEVSSIITLNSLMNYLEKNDLSNARQYLEKNFNVSFPIWH